MTAQPDDSKGSTVHDIVTADELRTLAREALADELAELVIDGGAPETEFDDEEG